MFAKLVSLLPVLGFSSVSFAAQQEILKSDGNNPLNANFSKIVKESLEIFHVPGISIAVIDGEDVWAEVSERTSFHLLKDGPHSIMIMTG
jgi:hypothetical protein